MKKLISVLLISIIIITMMMITTSCKEEIDTSIKVMSFNIRTMTNEADEMNNWSNRKDFVLSIINEYDADLIGFQELKYSQYEFMKENLTEYGYYGIDRTGTLFGETVAIFYKKSRFISLEEYTFWLSETPETVSLGWDAKIHRTCSVVKLRDLLTDKVITHYNTHFDHQGVEARANSGTLLLERISQTQGEIVTGDFNFPEGNAVYNTLISGTLKDVKYLAPADNTDTGGTFNGFGLSGSTMPIDFIFVNNAYFKVNKYSIIRDTRDGYYPSDHYPIISIIDYND